MDKRLLKTLIGILIGAIFIFTVNYIFDLGLDPVAIGIMTVTILLINIIARPLFEKKNKESDTKSPNYPVLRLFVFILAIATICGAIIFVGESLNLGS